MRSTPKYHNKLKNIIITNIKKLDNLRTIKFDYKLLNFFRSYGLNPKYEKEIKQ
jgi:hypothetical protein